MAARQAHSIKAIFKQETDSTTPCLMSETCDETKDCWLVGNMLVYLRDGSALTSLHAATLRQQLEIKLSTSTGHSILTPNQPVPTLTL